LCNDSKDWRLQPESLKSMRSPRFNLAEFVFLHLLCAAMQAGSVVLGICH